MRRPMYQCNRSGGDAAMDEEQVLRKLAAAARGDWPPAIDVADGVLAGLAERAEPPKLLLWSFTAASSVAAAAVTIAALWVWAVRNDPAVSIVNSMMAVLP